MFRLSKKEILKTVAAGLVVVLMFFIGSCSMNAADAADSAQPVVTVKKLSLNKKGQPRVRITATEPVEILFSLPGADSTADDLVPQEKGTKTYSLHPRVKPGAKATWYVTVFVAGGPDELASERFVWKRANLKRFVWRNVENPAPSACPKGRGYTFWLQSKPRTRYLTAESKLKLRLVKPNGRIVTRKLDLAFGDGDLVWTSRVGARATVKKAWVRASWRGKTPRQGVDLFCAGT